jgi:hypothetical protein
MAPAAAWRQRRVGEAVLDVVVDDGRFRQHKVAVLEHRNHAVRVQRQELGRELLEAPQVQHPARMGDALLGEAEPDLLRAGGG